MKTSIRLLSAMLPLAAVFWISDIRAQGPAFTFQGQLSQDGGPASGLFDFTFTLHDMGAGGVLVAGPLTNGAVLVSNGLFAATLDFGAEAFDGSDLWLEISVRTNGAGAFVPLEPRQPVTATPYAITAANVSGSGLAGTFSGAVTFGNPSNVFNGNFTGSGSGLVDVNAASVGGIAAEDLWRTTGNGGTSAGSHFLGTTDEQPFEIKVNGLRAMRIEFAGDSSDLGTTPDGAPNLILGSPVNYVAPGVAGATISGGGATNYFSLVYSNSVSADFSTIAGGRGNIIRSGPGESTISGGHENLIQTNVYASTIAGGARNTIEQGVYGVAIAGGLENAMGRSTDYSVIGGGRLNKILASRGATIGGGTQNEIQDHSGDSTIAGGAANIIEPFSTDATIGGGNGHRIRSNSKAALVSGGSGNDIRKDSDYATIGGGERNLISTNSDHSVIVGGRENKILTALSSTISGGYFNSIMSGASYSCIGGGEFNQVSSTATLSAIGGGYFNAIHAGAYSALVAGGANNEILPDAGYAAILGGKNNTATNHAFAAGNRAKAIHTGAFVWGDSTEADVSSTNADSVTLRASGGARLFTSSNLTAGVFLAPDATSWSSVSDRKAKKHFQSVDTISVLEKLAEVPMLRWNYQWETDDATPHLGPMAQDFKRVFYPGRDDRSITTQEIDGVALAAIQGLNEKVEEQRTELHRRQAEITGLKERLEKLEQLLLRRPGGNEE